MDESRSTSGDQVAPAAKARTAPARARNILLVEGNRLHQKIATRMLETEGCRVTTISTVDLVLPALLQGPFDLILIDAEMLALNGFEATLLTGEHKTSTGGRIPIAAMMSGTTQANRRLGAEIDYYLTKPLSLDQLRRVFVGLRPADAVPIFDQATALSRLGGDRAFLCRLALMFVEDSPALVVEIRAAIEQQDGERLSQAAHMLKGSAHILSAVAVAGAAQTLESIGASGRLTTAMTDFCRFEAEMGRLLTALSALPLGAGGQQSPAPAITAGPEGAIPCTA